jgi:murein DD-endopeptidase MepM/ murein hydrolase activator NlpD
VADNPVIELDANGIPNIIWVYRRDRSVHAAEAGTVSRVGWENPRNHRQGYGYRIYVRTASGEERYAHMEPSSVIVTEGSTVEAGDYLGRYGDPPTGNVSGPHVHFERRNSAGAPINPGDLDITPGGRRTSGFGPRPAPVPGASTLHKGVDYVGPAVPR